jgi:hypothetical protein
MDKVVVLYHSTVYLTLATSSTQYPTALEGLRTTRCSLLSEDVSLTKRYQSSASDSTRTLARSSTEPIARSIASTYPDAPTSSMQDQEGGGREGGKEGGRGVGGVGASAPSLPLPVCFHKAHGHPPFSQGSLGVENQEFAHTILYCILISSCNTQTAHTLQTPLLVSAPDSGPDLKRCPRPESPTHRSTHAPAKSPPHAHRDPLHNPTTCSLLGSQRLELQLVAASCS